MATATAEPASRASGAKSAKKGRTIREAITLVLKDAEEPMTPAAIYKDIKRRRLAPSLKGKTPVATISAQLSINGEFERVSRGLYRLGD